jgi:HlyD family secretion protein
MRNLRKHLLTLIIGIIVVAATVAAVWPTPAEVDGATVTRGPLRVTIDEEGETRVRDRFVVAAPVAGRLQRIELEPGDRVVRGKTVVARLTAVAAPLLDGRTQTEYQASVAAARAAIGQARAGRDRALAEQSDTAQRLTRQQALSAAGLIPRDTLDAAQTAAQVAAEAVRAAEFAVARAEYELQLAETRLAGDSAGSRTIVLVAPVDGVVLKRLRESETVVPAGEALVEIADAVDIEIVSDMLSSDAVQLRAGGAVSIEQWGGDQPLAATIRRIEPSGFMKVSALGVEEQRVNVVIDLKNPAAAVALGDGYRVEVRAVAWETASALKVPTGSLFRSGDDWAVFVIDGEVAKLQKVAIGRRNDREAEVTGGLTEGQVVVVHPSDALHDGTLAVARLK